MEYFIYKDNRQQGPYTPDQLAGIGISSETLVWREGMPQWTPAWQVDELRAVLAAVRNPGAMPPPVTPTDGQQPQAEQPLPGGGEEEDAAEAAPAAASHGDKRRRRPAVWLAVAAVAFFILLMTCPDADQHRKAVADEVTAAVTEEIYDKGTGNDLIDMFGGMVGSMIATQFVDAVVGQMVNVDDYFIFSIGKVHFDGKEKAVSLGILGHVFTFDSADLRKALDDNNPVPDTMAV